MDDAAVRDRGSALRAAQAEWEAIGLNRRARPLYRLRDWLLEHRQAIGDVLQSETGKPRAEADLEPALAAAWSTNSPDTPTNSCATARASRTGRSAWLNG